jgi:hypothetical protein
MSDITVQDRLEALVMLAETRLERIEKQQSEIERLRAAQAYSKETWEMQAKEIERLRRVIEIWERRARVREALGDD